MLGKLCPSLLHEKHTTFGTSGDGPRVVVAWFRTLKAVLKVAR